MPKKTSLAILFFAAIIFGLQFVPARYHIRLDSYTAERVLEFTPRDLPVVKESRVAVVATRRRSAGVRPTLDMRGLVDPAGDMTAFYQALWRTEAKVPGAVTRVLHYGDSPVTADSITADARSILQKRFGDAGHGFVLIAKPWAWYGHRGVEVEGKGWRIAAATQVRAKDGFHGLGGVSFEGDTGATSSFELAEDHAQMEIHFLRQPDGGVLTVEAEGQKLGQVETAGPDKEPAYQTFPLNAGVRQIDLSVERGPVRLFGVSFERNAPGVI